MDPTARVPLDPGRVLAGEEKVALFLGHYDLRIYITPRSYVDIGAWSLGGMKRLVLTETEEVNGSLGTIGRWCEFALTCEIFGSGEHDHDQPVNLSLAVLRNFSAVPRGFGMKSPRPINIGSGVTISAGARVLSGASIGDGAVVGANAVVTRDVEPFSIVAGVPARSLRTRTPSIPWWNFSAAYLREHGANDLNATVLGDGPHDWMQERPRFALQQNGANTSILGFVENGQLRHFSEAPPRVREYLTQAVGPGPYYWMADCWAES